MHPTQTTTEYLLHRARSRRRKHLLAWRRPRAGRLWSLLSALALIGVMLPESGQAGEPAHWVLPGSLWCGFVPCAVFREAGPGGGKILQTTDEVELSASGLLEVPEGGTDLLFRVGSQESGFHIKGPSLVRLTDRGEVEPLGATELRKSGQARGYVLGVGPLVLSSQHTRYTVVVSPGGTLCVQVTAGAVEVRPAGAFPLQGLPPGSGPSPVSAASPPGSSPTVLERGEGLCAFPDSQGTLEIQTLSGRALHQELRRLSSAIHDTQVRGNGSPREALADLTIRLPSLEGKALVEEVDGLVRAHPDSQEAPRALYLAWRKASTAQDATTGDVLASQLKQRYPESLWCAVLEQAEPPGTLPQPARLDGSLMAPMQPTPGK